MRGTPPHLVHSCTGEVTLDREGFERLAAALARPPAPPLVHVEYTARRVARTPAACQETPMQGEINVKRGVCEGRPYWNIRRGDVFVCRVYSEAAVRTTVERLEVLAAQKAGA